MTHLLTIPFLLLALALPALAEEMLPGDTNTGTNAGTPLPPPPPPYQKPSENTKPPEGALPQPGMRPRASTSPSQPPRLGSSSPMMERKELFLENQGERKEFREGLASSTKANMLRRSEFLPLGPIGSTTRAAILEKRGEFPNFVGSTTRGIMLERRDAFLEDLVERREHFASSTAAQILDMREKKEERREHFASSTALAKLELTEEMKARILAQAEHAAELLDAMLGRLAGIAERIAGRIEELATAGVDTVSAEAQLAEAYDAISDAESAVADVKAKVDEALQSETPGDMMREAKTAGEAAKAALRAAHEALREAAEALPKPDPEGTDAPNE